MCELELTFIYPRLAYQQDAGLTYKDILKADLKRDPRVIEVIDVGVNGDETTHYPHVAVAAARKIAAGEADRGLLICGTGLGMSLFISHRFCPHHHRCSYLFVGHALPSRFCSCVSYIQA